MKYYENIVFEPTVTVDPKGSLLARQSDERLAWAEAVACAILNYTKEDCCLTVRKVIDLLIEANRIGLLPGDQSGKKAEDINVGTLIGAATQRFRKILNHKGYFSWGQVAVVQNYVSVPLAEADPDTGLDTRSVEFYYFLLNPKVLKEMYGSGKLPRSKTYVPRNELYS